MEEAAALKEGEVGDKTMPGGVQKAEGQRVGRVKGAGGSVGDAEGQKKRREVAGKGNAKSSREGVGVSVVEGMHTAHKKNAHRKNNAAFKVKKSGAAGRVEMEEEIDGTPGEDARGGKKEGRRASSRGRQDWHVRAVVAWGGDPMSLETATNAGAGAEPSGLRERVLSEPLSPLTIPAPSPTASSGAAKRSSGREQQGSCATARCLVAHSLARR
jgi:hypothetical protein